MEKVSRGFVFGRKLKHKHRCVKWCVIMVQIHDWFFHNSVHFWWIASRNRRITSRQYSLVTVWPCRKNSWYEQNLHIRPNLTCLAHVLLSFRWLGFGFDVIDIHPWFVTSYELFAWVLRDTLNGLIFHMDSNSRILFVHVLIYSEMSLIAKGYFSLKIRAWHTNYSEKKNNFIICTIYGDLIQQIG